MHEQVCGAMGLAPGENGPKAVLKRICAPAFRALPTLEEVRDVVGVDRSEVLCVADGNVALRGIPSSVRSFDNVVKFFGDRLLAYAQSAEHLVVVFDEPVAMTKAKQAEQQARDAKASQATPQCSDDLQLDIPTTDDYAEEALHHRDFNAPYLMANCRGARSRFIDAVCLRVHDHVVARMRHEGLPFSLCFDGVDERGAHRPVGEARVAGVKATHDEWKRVLARSTAIGEGDLKVTDVTQRVRDDATWNPTSPFKNVLLNLIVTIDTDSLIIEVLEQTRRAVRVAETEIQEMTILCLSERSMQRSGDDFRSPAHFTCVDIELLHECLVEQLYGTASLDEATNATVGNALRLLAAALALCGCDFCKLRGLRSDFAIAAVGELVRKKPHLVQSARFLASADANEAKRALPAIEAFVDNYANSVPHGRLRASANKVALYTKEDLLKALWTAAYWSGNEFHDVEAFGFVLTR
jgi:hypothetical protein